MCTNKINNNINEIGTLEVSKDHPHIVQYYESFRTMDTNDIWIIMEWIDGITIGKVFMKSHLVKPSHIAAMCKALMLGLQHLELQNISHNDVTAANIMLGKDGSIKLIDMGMASCKNKSAACSILPRCAAFRRDTTFLEDFIERLSKSNDSLKSEPGFILAESFLLEMSQESSYKNLLSHQFLQSAASVEEMINLVCQLTEETDSS